MSEFTPQKVDLGAFQGAAPSGGCEGKCLGGPLNGQFLQNPQSTVIVNQAANKENGAVDGVYTYDRSLGVWRWSN